MQDKNKMNKYQIRSIISFLSFFIFYYGGLNLFDINNNNINKIEFILLWIIGVILIGFVIIHWINLIRIILKNKNDNYKGLKTLCLILFGPVASWVYPFLFKDINQSKDIRI
jgi:hypothetical protein